MTTPADIAARTFASAWLRDACWARAALRSTMVATIEPTATITTNAKAFSGSLMVKVPTGAVKNQFAASAAITAVRIAGQRPPIRAVPTTPTRYVNTTVVSDTEPATGSSSSVTSAGITTAATQASRRRRSAIRRWAAGGPVPTCSWVTTWTSISSESRTIGSACVGEQRSLSRPRRDAPDDDLGPVDRAGEPQHGAGDVVPHHGVERPAQVAGELA